MAVGYGRLSSAADELDRRPIPRRTQSRDSGLFVCFVTRQSAVKLLQVAMVHIVRWPRWRLTTSSPTPSGATAKIRLSNSTAARRRSAAICVDYPRRRGHHSEWRSPLGRDSSLATVNSGDLFSRFHPDASSRLSPTLVPRAIWAFCSSRRLDIAPIARTSKASLVRATI